MNLKDLLLLHGLKHAWQTYIAFQDIGRRSRQFDQLRFTIVSERGMSYSLKSVEVDE